MLLLRFDKRKLTQRSNGFKPWRSETVSSRASTPQSACSEIGLHTFCLFQSDIRFLLFYFQILWLLNHPYLSFRIIAVGSEQIKSGWLRSVSLLSLALLRLDGFPMIRTFLLNRRTCLIDRVKGCLPGEFRCFN